MDRILNRIGARALRGFDPETAHRLSIHALRMGLVPAHRTAVDKRLSLDAAGLHFNNPLGVAAGYDKNAEVSDAVLRLGFGFVEIGTVTPHPQHGNPRPRIFRLKEDAAVINRLGFNNDGHRAVLARLKRRKASPGAHLGVNVGANKDATDRIADYARGIEVFYDVADYFTVNISSPNTPGLRDLQARHNLAVLMEAVCGAREREMTAGAPRRPIFLKIAPDLTEADMDDIAEEIGQHPLDGLIISNTTLSRTGLKSRHAGETGGVSGTPLFERSTILLAKMRQRVGPDLTLIGVGGVDSGRSALEKIRAGADLVQLYTGFIYGGAGLPGRILRDMTRLIENAGVSSVTDLRDRHLDDWAAKPLPQ